MNRKCEFLSYIPRFVVLPLFIPMWHRHIVVSYRTLKKRAVLRKTKALLLSVPTDSDHQHSFYNESWYLWHFGQKSWYKKSHRAIKSLCISIYQPLCLWFVLWQLLLADTRVWSTYLFGIFDAEPKMAETIPLAQYETINAFIS